MIGVENELDNSSTFVIDQDIYTEVKIIEEII